MVNDFRLVTARQLLWKNDPLSDPGFRGLVIRTLEDMAGNENECEEVRTEAAWTIEKLFEQAKAAVRKNKKS